MTSQVWMSIGFLGQLVFSLRFIVQWIASERRRESVIPIAFWYISLTGSAVLFAYAMHRHDPVFMLGQGVGVIVYVRNLMLIYGKRVEA